MTAQSISRDCAGHSIGQKMTHQPWSGIASDEERQAETADCSNETGAFDESGEERCDVTGQNERNKPRR